MFEKLHCFRGRPDLLLLTPAMKSTHKNCQSCGMPLKRDKQGVGTNTDGSKSTVYCSHCFQRGQFVLPDITEAQMQELVRQKMAEMGIPRFLAGFYTRKIPKLERWQANAR
jgi:hypothetical protein